MKHFLTWIAFGLAGAALTAEPAVAQPQQTIDLFNGEDLSGWEARPGEEKWWRVEDGVIVGGSLTENVPHNTFLATTKSFQNFELEFDIRVLGSEGFINSGFQIRSIRVEGNHEMSGYQVDAGDGWWGKMYDESRRNKVLSEAADLAAVNAAIQKGGWNRYRIRAQGHRIQSWINDVPALDFSEKDMQIPQDGHFGLQVHGGGKVRVEMKDVQVKILPSTAGIMTWRRWQKAQSVQQQGSAPIRSAADELAGFDVLEGFEVELVASDPSMQKVVDINFDDAGRMWAITAVEYPIDGNESADVINLYRKGGRDQVLVFDDVWKPGPHKPRVFADGLFIPMAILPEQNGALVGMGPEILRFTDDDGDGRADRREVVLSGFGIQDSHLLPHRFKRMPGGWVYLAQGAFNSSNVRATTGEITPFNKCKVGRFRSDGSKFEVVGIGLNNIWGFVIDRNGDKWIQEANDLGYSMTPFEHGMSYPGIGSEKFHSHSPWRPRLAEYRVGGTGLSGLAQSGDRNGFPPPWDQTFFLANPIISSVQSVEATRTAENPTDVQLQRVADLLISEDKNFRPVACHFGPDGCLYIVDWYNPIISHNEVPRDHPLRDKTSSRIWRIRHSSQKHIKPLDLTKVATEQLPSHLANANTHTARAAWHQIVDRNATQLTSTLISIAQNPGWSADARLLAIWSLHDLKTITNTALTKLIQDPVYSLRRAAIDLAGEQITNGDLLAELLQNTPADTDPRVRLVAIHALGKANNFNSLHAALLLEFLNPTNLSIYRPSTGNASELQKADEALERSAIRAILEEHPQMVLKWLNQNQNYAGNKVSLELKRYALLCAANSQAAAKLADLLQQNNGQANNDEMVYLARNAGNPQVRSVLETWLSQSGRRGAVMRSLLQQRGQWQDATLKSAMASSARAMVREQGSKEHHQLLLQVARELRLTELQPDVVKLHQQGKITPLAAVQALREMGSQDVELYAAVAQASLPGEELRRTAISALAAVNSQAAFDQVVALWPSMQPISRGSAMRALLSHREHAARVLQQMADGDQFFDVMDEAMVEQLRMQAQTQPKWAAVEARLNARRLPGIRLGGGGNDYVQTNLSQSGAFTIEAWIRLNPGISNADGLLAGPNWDLNFHDARPRLWLGPRGDVIISQNRIPEQAWVHLALTYDGGEQLHLYLDGKLDQSAQHKLPAQTDGLQVGKTTPNVGTDGWLSEVRYWTVARTADQIAASYRLRMDPQQKPEHLQLLLPASDHQLSGKAKLSGMFQTPPLMSEAEAKAEQQRFDRYRDLAAAGGDLGRGKIVFQSACLACHIVDGVGGDIGPALDGVGSKTADGLLRSVLTPNAGVESGYRVLTVKTNDGQLLQGFLAADNDNSITLRRAGREDLEIPRSTIASLSFAERSLMPEGLLDTMQPQQVSDLFHYLRSLH